VITVITCSLEVLGQDCIDYAEYRHVVSRLVTDNVHQVGVAGNTACYLNGDTFKVLDISDPASPAEMGSVSISGAVSLTIIGNLALVAVGDAGLQIIDISDLATPALRGLVDSPGSSRKVVAVSNMAFIADQTGLAIVDFSDPDNPYQLGYLDELNEIDSVCYGNGYVFLGAVHPNRAHLLVVDVSDPSSPYLAYAHRLQDGTYQTINDLGYCNGHVYVVRRSLGVVNIVDVSEPLLPETVGIIRNFSHAQDIDIVGSNAFFIDRSGWYPVKSSILVYDISQPDEPALISSSNTFSVNSNCLAVNEQVVCVAELVDGMTLYSAESLLNPPGLASVSVDSPKYVTAATSWQDTIYFACSDSMITVAEYLGPQSTQVLGQVKLTGPGYGIRLHDQYLAVATRGRGLQIVSISDPHNPTIVSTHLDGAALRDLDEEDELLYAVDDVTGYLYVVDATNPLSPVTQSALLISGEPYSVDAQGSFAYVANYELGLQVIDISDPANPFLRGSWDYGSYRIHDVSAKGNVICLAGDYVFGRIFTINVMDPDNPVMLGYAQCLGHSKNIMSNGIYAYLVDTNHSGSSVVEIYDISDPTAPVHHGDWGLGSHCTSLNPGDGTILAGTSHNGLVIGEPQCSNMQAPVILAPGAAAQVWGTPTIIPIIWQYDSGPSIDHFLLSYSTDGGNNYRDLTTIDYVGGPLFQYNWEAPPISTVELDIRIDAKNAWGNVVGSGVSDTPQVLRNNNGVMLQHFSKEYNGGNLYGSISETHAVIVWTNTMPAADHYEVTIKADKYSRCGDLPFTDWPDDEYRFEVTGIDPGSGIQECAVEVPIAAYATMPPARYAVNILGCDAIGNCETCDTQTFIVCRVGDLDPYDDEGKPPVLLVHGWTGDSNSWFFGENGDRSCDVCDGLASGSGTPSNKRHPWAFDYPNSDGVQTSAAGLGDALVYINFLSGHTEASIIAHSMGGLVSRTYLQSEAMSPGPYTVHPYGPYRGDVARLATLGTPHLGEAGSIVASIYNLKKCPLASFGQARSDLDNNGSFVAELAAEPLPSDVEYFFAAGSNVEGDVWQYEVSNHILLYFCHWDNDSIVSSCSATGGYYFQGTEYVTMNFGGSTPWIRGYALGHFEMAHPGCDYADDPIRAPDSIRLLDDVLSFTRSGVLFGEYEPGMLPEIDDAATVNIGIVDAEHTIPFLKMRYGAGKGHSSRSTAYRRSVGEQMAVTGAQIAVRDPGQVDRGGGIVHTTDLAGLAELRIEPGTYQIEVNADGYSPRNEQLVVADSLDNYIWDIALEPEAGGLRHPTVTISGGAAATMDTVVTVSLACEGATQYQLSDFPIFDDLPWLPMAAAKTCTLDGDEGPHVIYGRYRDGYQDTSAVVWDQIYYLEAAFGSVTVTASPVEGEIYLNGGSTGLLTPAIIDSLPPGNHYLTVSAVGYRSTPVIAAVEVSSGGSHAIDFLLTSIPAPPPTDPTSLGASDYLSGLPFTWDVPSGWNPNDPLFYDLRISTDATQDSLVFGQMSIMSRNLDLGTALEDSQQYYISLASRDIHGIGQAEAPEVRMFFLDQTPPDVTLLSPAAGDTLPAGGQAILETMVVDWGGLDTFVATLSLDGGASYPDTLWNEEWMPILDMQVPSYGLADSCLILVAARDLAGNICFAASDSFLVIHDGITAVSGSGATGQFRLIVAGSNPNTSLSQLAIEVSPGARARVVVYDIRGRRVRTLLNEPVPTGIRDITWDGRDESERRVSAGVYLLSLESQGKTAVRKIAVIR